MPPNAVEPGTRLVDRYRLDKHLGEAAGTTYWRAHDELLDRAVGVCLLPADADHADHADRVLRAARRAAAVTDPRFLRVLDASEVDGVVYVVNEWVRATSLTALLADGPLPGPEVRAMTVEIAEALGAAHRDGLAHLCLEPEHVLRTHHGQVKIVGLAVEAAVRGLDADGPWEPAAAARRDTQGAAQVAYAALTARWPGGTTAGLAPAPHDGEALCSPRQVRAGVPHDLDEVVARALEVPGAHGPPLHDPGALAAALGEAHTTRVPAVGQLPAQSSTDSYPPGHIAPYEDIGRRRPARTTLLAWAAVALVLLVGLTLAGSQTVLTLLDGDDETQAAGPSASPSATPSATGAPLAVESVRSFDPEGDDGEENEDRVGLAVDGDRATAWTTKTYFDQFGDTGLKQGVGLLLDLGSAQDVSAVTVRTRGGGTGLELRAADRAGAVADDYRVVADPQPDVDGQATLRPREALRARYLLVWLTALPAVGSDFRGEITEVAVRGG